MTGARGRLRDPRVGAAVALTEAWEVRASAPGALADPAALPTDGWLPARAPSTAAAALRAAGRFSLDGTTRAFDAEDWWWRTRFAAPPASPGEETVLCFDGLATVADVWLNGAPILASDNMFVAHECPVALAPDNELVIRFRGLDPLLAAKRPRPRWRTPMVAHQQLRAFRTTLLGRTPGWSPPAAPVGPWREIRLERRAGTVLRDLRLQPRVDGTAGHLEVTARIGGATPARLELVLEREGRQHRAPLSVDQDRCRGHLELPAPALWWPHTHGAPALYQAWIEASGPLPVRLELGAIGFRDVAVDTTGDGFAISINGAPVFCRGACWTPLDPLALTADRAALATAIDQAVDAGMNMLRLCGPMTYESDDFYDLCDERGVMVWQDFMFANMDYPEDEAFTASVRREADQLLARLQGRPALTVLCGSSEGEQQAAMWGADRARWSPPLFYGLLAESARAWCPDVPYWPSSAHRGAFPHQPSVGTTSYYGVGAYLRPLEDARRSEVRFASECLAFANVPDEAGLPGGPSVKVHQPEWKRRSPRDLGAGWDFDDVRDHYLRLLFGVDPVALRWLDHDRYLALGRVVTGEVMAEVFSEWRRARSPCQGGLVWFLRDLWPGAGWGIVDASGEPKAPYWYLRRALAPITVAVSDEGLNGLVIHVHNERPAPLDAELAVALFRAGEIPVGGATRAVALAARASEEIPVVALLEGFRDLSCAYRFGPPTCDLVVATLRSGGAALAQAVHFPAGRPAGRELQLGLTAEVAARADGDADLVVRTRRFAQAIAIQGKGLRPDDNYFHLAPGAACAVRLRRRPGATGPLRGAMQALNAESASSFVVPA